MNLKMICISTNNILFNSFINGNFLTETKRRKTKIQLKRAFDHNSHHFVLFELEHNNEFDKVIKKG